MNSLMFIFMVAAAAVISCLYFLKRATNRSALAVLSDLKDERQQSSFINDSNNFKTESRAIDYSLIDPEGVVQSRRLARRLPWIFLLTVPTIKASFIPGSIFGLAVSGLIGLAAGYLIAQRITARINTSIVDRIEFYLPIVMERISMAVQAGLDIIAAVNVVVQHGTKKTIAVDCGPEFGSADPVTRLLARALVLTENGLGFEQSLYRAVEGIPSNVLRHAVTYLAYAYKQGGELVMPLRELSDSTQLYFQEKIEEQVAKLPVKATAPLLCTFAGLIICFITVPIVQVMTIAQKSAQHSAEISQP